MNKLKTGKGALKDYNRYLADEYDDYAEEPEDYDPIAHIAHSNTYQKQVIPKKLKAHKLTIKQTSRWPEYQPDYNFVRYSGGIFEGLVGEKIAQYLTISDVAKVLRTCEYLNRIFSKASIWAYYLTKSYHTMDIPKTALPSMNLMQYSKYLRGARNYDVFFEPNEALGMKNDGIMFDTVIMERSMKNEEEKLLARNVVDYMTVKSEKTRDTINKLALQGTITGDVKISLIKEMNQVCVWVAGYHARNNSLRTIAGILLNRKYDEETQLVNKAYFLNDRYFAIEIEEKSGENEEEEVVKTFEVFAIEPEPNWLEKKEAALCKQVLKESVDAEQKIRLKMIGDFLVFLVEKENNFLSVQVFNLAENDKHVYKSEDLHLDASLSDVILSKCVTQQESSFSLYLIDKESNVYLLNYNIESGVTIKKVNQPEIDNEEKQEFESPEQRFLDPVRKYYHGTYKVANGKTVEYLMIYKEKKFYLLKSDNNNELVHCELPEYDDVNLRFYNWTIYGNYLYLLLDTTIYIYQLDFLNCSAVLYKWKTIMKAKFNGDHARWILVNPCMTIIVSASSLVEGFVRSLQLFMGSTQRLLMKVDPVLAFKSEKFDSEKLKGLERKWHYDECRLDNIVGHIDKWQINGKEKIEFKFEDERLLIQTETRSYFRDFNVYERRLRQEQYGWKVQAIENLSESTVPLVKSSLDLQHQQNLMKKKNDMKFAERLEAFDNKNHENSHQKKRNQNWNSIEKKADTEKKIERKETRMKGEKYFKNVRQGKHREKMYD